MAKRIRQRGRRRQREAVKTDTIDWTSGQLQQELGAEIREDVLVRMGFSQPDNDDLRVLIAEAVNARLLGRDAPLAVRQNLSHLVFNQMRGLDILQPLMDDPEITEVMVNGPDTVFIERHGRLESTGLRFRDQQHLMDVITQFFSSGNRQINYWQPIADLRMEDGSRANATLPPIAPDGPILTIRKFTGIRPDRGALLRSGSLTEACLDLLCAAVARRESVFISGGTGTGKTTLLNILSAAIPAADRVITIEEAAELNLQQTPNLVRLEARSAGPDGHGAVTISDLIKAALRMRPDRIIIGEVRGDEAADLLTSMNTGHPGTLSTAHANSCEDLIHRLANLILRVSPLPYETIVRDWSYALDLIVQLERTADGRRQVAEVVRVHRDIRQGYRLERLFVRDGEGELRAAGHESVRDTTQDAQGPLPRPGGGGQAG